MHILRCKKGTEGHNVSLVADTDQGSCDGHNIKLRSCFKEFELCTVSITWLYTCTGKKYASVSHGADCIFKIKRIFQYLLMNMQYVILLVKLEKMKRTHQKQQTERGPYLLKMFGVCLSFYKRIKSFKMEG